MLFCPLSFIYRISAIIFKIIIKYCANTHNCCFHRKIIHRNYINIVLIVLISTVISRFSTKLPVIDCPLVGNRRHHYIFAFRNIRHCQNIICHCVKYIPVKICRCYIASVSVRCKLKSVSIFCVIFHLSYPLTKSINLGLTILNNRRYHQKLLACFFFQSCSLYRSVLHLIRNNSVVLILCEPYSVSFTDKHTVYIKVKTECQFLSVYLL